MKLKIYPKHALSSESVMWEWDLKKKKKKWKRNEKSRNREREEKNLSTPTERHRKGQRAEDTATRWSALSITGEGQRAVGRGRRLKRRSGCPVGFNGIDLSICQNLCIIVFFFFFFNFWLVRRVGEAKK